MSKLSLEQKMLQKLVKVSFDKGQFNSPKVKQIISVLKTLSKGTAIMMLDGYLKLIKKELDAHRLVIEAPMAFPQKAIDEITEIVEKYTPVFETEMIVNKDLVAGFKIQIGDVVYEDSFRDKIAQVRKAIES